jgi:hypothetical protein
MKTTKDTLTGKPFRWNSTCFLKTARGDFVVPERMTSRTASYLHPSRVPAHLLAQLNDGRTWPETQEVLP